MVSYLLYRLGEFVTLNLPLPVSYAIAVFMCDIRGFFARQDRDQVRMNVRVVLPDISEREISQIQKQMFRNFAKYLVDLFRFAKLDREALKHSVRYENFHYFEQALSKGKGVVALTAHLGNWELAGAAVACCGHPVVAVALPHKNSKVNDFFNSIRKNKGITVVALGNAARSCFGALKKNKIIALVGDRDFLENGPVVQLFGKPTHLPVGPAVFSLKTGAPIVPAFMLRNADDSFTLHVEKPIEFRPTGDSKRDTAYLMNRCKAVIEDYVKQYPAQWFMFRRFWIA